MGERAESESALAPAVEAATLAGRRFRASPRYELVLFDRLAPAEQRALARLREEPGFYGVLRPREGAGLSVKAVDRETALLLLTLAEPAPLPSYLMEALGAALPRTVARLVADGALEVEAEGAFLAGSAALGLLAAGEPREDASGRGRLAELSLAGLCWAAGLPVEDPAILAARLYAWNRLPLTPRWARLLPTEGAVRDWLGLSPGGPAAAALAAWAPLPARGAWFLWGRRGWGSRGAPSRPISGSLAGPTFKLYLSPRPEELPTALAAALEVLPEAGAGRLKVGSDAPGVLRPDKLVAYFGELDRLAAAGEALAERLSGLAVQGVPFTAEIGGDGLLSWGVEPTAPRRLPGGRESWRLWLVQRLGLALAEARAAGEPEPWRFALERLRLEGIDPASWSPRGQFWAEG